MENLPNNELSFAFSAPSNLNQTVCMTWAGWMKEKTGNPLANGAISKQKAGGDLSRWSTLFMFHTVLWNRNQDNCLHLPGLICWVVVCAAYTSRRPKLTFFQGRVRPLTSPFLSLPVPLLAAWVDRPWQMPCLTRIPLPLPCVPRGASVQLISPLEVLPVDFLPLPSALLSLLYLSLQILQPSGQTAAAWCSVFLLHC